MSALFVTTPDGHVRSVPLEGERLSLGRSTENALAFPEDSGLSRLHLAFEREGDHWSVQDLGSKNGTYVNGGKISGKHPLKAGDQIRAGRVTIIFKDRESGASTTVLFEEPADSPSLTTESVSLKEAISAAAERLGPAAASVAERAPINALWAFVRAGRELAVRRPLPEMFRVILDLSLEAVGAERGLLLTLDENDRLVVQASSGGEFRISTTVQEKVLKQKASLLVVDVEQDEALLLSQTIARHGVHSLMAVPLQTDDRVLGLIYLDSLGLRHSFTADDLNLLTVLANVASIFIERERWEAQRRALISENVATLEHLAAALSHEMNSPLGALKSTMESLVRLSAKQATASPEERSDLAEIQANLHATIAASVDRMQRVIARMQRFTHLDRAEILSVDINELVIDVITLLETSGDEQPELEFYFDELPPVVCRAQHLVTVFSNVVRNAVAACRDTGRPGKIFIRTQRRGDAVEVEIEDNGKGIPSEQLAHIFDPGFRVLGGRMAAGNWSLFSARQIVREHGGDIRIASEVDKGTRISITIPSQSALAKGA